MVYGDRLMRLLAEEALCRLPSIKDGEVITPCGVAQGLVEKRKMDICLVSVVRSGILSIDIYDAHKSYSIKIMYTTSNMYNIKFVGDILQEAVRQLEPGVKIGKILIQRDESTVEKTPKLFYKKLPKDIPDCFVILVDPMLATAGMSIILENTYMSSYLI